MSYSHFDGITKNGFSYSYGVRKAAKHHPAKEAKELRAAKDKRENKREKMHTDYLDTLKRKRDHQGLATYSPVGSYVVDCEELEEQWEVDANDLKLSIYQTGEPGIFEASFHLGLLEGIMIIGAEKNTLEQYCSELDREAGSDWDQDEDKDEDEVVNNRKSITGFIQKNKDLQDGGRPIKKPEARVPRSRTYLLRLKGRETGEGEVEYRAEKGSIKFKDERMAALIGKVNLPWVSGVRFSARKTSDTPVRSRNKWADYSEKAHVYGRVRRWH